MVKRISRSRLAATVAAMLGVQLLLLAVLSGVPLTTPVLSPGSGASAGYDVWRCSSTSLHALAAAHSPAGITDASFSIWLGVQLGYVGLGMLLLCWLAFSVRNVPQAFNESSHLLNCAFLLLLFLVLIVPLQFLIDDDVNALILIRGVGQCFACFALLAALFAPKMYFILVGRANDKSMQNNNRTYLDNEATSKSSNSQGAQPLQQQQEAIATRTGLSNGTTTATTPKQVQSMQPPNVPTAVQLPPAHSFPAQQQPQPPQPLTVRRPSKEVSLVRPSNTALWRPQRASDEVELVVASREPSPLRRPASMISAAEPLELHTNVVHQLLLSPSSAGSTSAAASPTAAGVSAARLSPRHFSSPPPLHPSSTSLLARRLVPGAHTTRVRPLDVSAPASTSPPSTGNSQQPGASFAHVE